MSNSKLAFLFLFLILIILTVIGVGVYDLGAKNMCGETGGVLIRNEIGMRCINVSNIDLCITEDKVILDKPINGIDYNVNWSI